MRDTRAAGRNALTGPRWLLYSFVVFTVAQVMLAPVGGAWGGLLFLIGFAACINVGRNVNAWQDER